ncbi:AQG_2a_G0021570.mRNA.1.CDS.1 [Saccharomyces cerevisiae]|nr:AQG_2a_G0021570.mRNA.1.CDS.1 [Saccharomyces cerevisiae]CAI7132022.1 AQG_2a_G0021570.mRNA.1.CDS.1 [Saccharomyces cerevisiae]
MSVRNLTNNRHSNSENSVSGSENSFYSSNEQSRQSSSLEPADGQNVRVSGNPFLGSEEFDEDYNSPSGDDERRGANEYSSSSSINYNNDPNSDTSLLANEKNSPERNGQRMSDYKGYYAKTNLTSANNLNNHNNNNYKNIISSSNDNSFASHLQPPDRNLPSHPSSNNMSSFSNNSLIKSPPPFDRYPLVGTRHISAAQSQSQNLINEKKRANMTGSSSSAHDSSLSSTNLYMGEQDFSPFGGYPASFFPLTLDEKEDDDYIHNPNVEEEAKLDRRRFVDDFKHMDRRSFLGLLGILFLFMAGIFIFIVLPAITFSGVVYHHEHVHAANSAGSSSSNTTSKSLTEYQYPQLAAIRTTLVDPDTPDSAKTRVAKDGSKWQLVFSDEFNAEGRTFYDGDDQFWTAPDIHYDATKDLEWYSPDAVTTTNGTLTLRMDAFRNHDLYYRSGMVQSWNKLCFTEGALEVSANLPNYGRVTGLWPGMWTMGNLGRPGYLASTQGVWPYSYEACDAGITPNQSSPDGISYLPGQKLSVCTCDNEDHPNQGVGRGAPEIDILEGEADTILGVGVASQSLQIAPFDIWYMPDYDFIEVYNFTTTTMNTYAGGPFQQAVSAISTLNVTWYEFGEEAGYFQKYAIEYLNDDDNGYIRWFVGENPTFTLYATSLHPSGNIDWRRISKEPMSAILNLGISNNWAYIDWQYLFFPVTMSIDYVRLYQPKGSTSITCDPEDYPTYDYIQSHLNAYYNANLTDWEQAGYTFPKNILTGGCSSSKFSLS